MTRWFAIRVSLVFAALLALTFSVGGLLAADPTKPVPASAPPSTKNLNVKCSHTVAKQIGNNVWQTTLTEAIVTQEDSTFTAKLIVVESAKKVHTMTCTGDPVFTDSQTRITADKVVGQSTPRWADFTGSVKMVVTPKKKEDGNSLKSQVSGEPSTITSDALSYDYGKKVAHGRGSVVVVQKNRTVWADDAVYEQKTDLVTMTGNIRMKNTGDEEVKEMKNADKVTVSLQDDWVDINAKPDEKVEYIIEVQDDQTPAEPAKGK